MIANKKEFSAGTAMLVGFFIVLGIIFMPVFNGHNGLNYLDSLYNSISKGSAYYIGGMKEEVATYGQKHIDVSITLPTEEMAKQAATLYNHNNALVNSSGNQLKVSGDLAMILTGCLDDADDLYANNDVDVQNRYGYHAREVLYNWWVSLHEIEKDLQKQKAFKDAKLIASVVKKAVEPSYNYYGIDAQKISDKLGIVLFSLIFYVIYTLWYGFAIMYMFEGWGMQLEDH